MVAGVTAEDEAVLLELLNSTPVVDRVPSDELADDDRASRWTADRGGTGSPTEVRHVRRVRDELQAVVRGDAPASLLQSTLSRARLVPEVDEAGVHWHLEVEEDRRLATRAVLAWGTVQEHLPGRLRPCGNHECRLFLLDRSRANSARWCSMAVCGNRMKARRHYRRRQGAP
jgi:predicted RNA-binding Zn ribbon-like protein